MIWRLLIPWAWLIWACQVALLTVVAVGPRVAWWRLLVHTLFLAWCWWLAVKVQLWRIADQGTSG